MPYPSNLEMKLGQGPPVIKINRQNDSKSLKSTFSKSGRKNSPASSSRDRTGGNPIKRLSSVYKRFLDSQKMSIILDYYPIISLRYGGICPNLGLDTWNRPSWRIRRTKWSSSAGPSKDMEFQGRSSTFLHNTVKKS